MTRRMLVLLLDRNKEFPYFISYCAQQLKYELYALSFTKL